MPLVEFEPWISTIKWLRVDALDHTITNIGIMCASVVAFSICTLFVKCLQSISWMFKYFYFVYFFNI